MQGAFISVSWAPVLILLRDLGQVTPLLVCFLLCTEKAWLSKVSQPRRGGGLGLVSLTHGVSPQSAERFCPPHTLNPLSPHTRRRREGGFPSYPLGRIKEPGRGGAPKATREPPGGGWGGPRH